MRSAFDDGFSAAFGAQNAVTLALPIADARDGTYVSELLEIPSGTSRLAIGADIDDASVRASQSAACMLSVEAFLLDGRVAATATLEWRGGDATGADPWLEVPCDAAWSHARASLVTLAPMRVGASFEMV